MEAGDLLTRATIWIALFGYTLGEIGRTGRWPRLSETRSRVVWSVGGLLYVTHVIFAFQVHHDWSHDAAYAATAAETSALVGLDWGGGIFVNYAFTLFWGAEVARWWLAPTAFRSQPWWLQQTTRAIFLFMIVNGAVIFVDGPMRWVGVVVAGVLVATWSADINRRPSPSADLPRSDR